MNTIRTGLGSIPEKFTPSNSDYLFGNFITPNLTKYLIDGKFKTQLLQNLTDCISESCRSVLKKGVGFTQVINILYPVTQSNNSFLEERPDFYLGRFLDSFLDKILIRNANIDFKNGTSSPDLSTYLWNMIVRYFTSGLLSYNEGHELTFLHDWYCTSFTQIMKNKYESFLDIVHHSESENSIQTKEQKQKFENDYLTNILFKQSKPRRPTYLNDQTGMIPFCSKVPYSNLSIVSALKPSTCDLFHRHLTPNGLCYSFNSLTMAEIYVPSESIDSFNTFLDLKKNSTLLKPLGHGPNYGLNFVLNSFERVNNVNYDNNESRSSQNFILSITNKNNPFDIFRQSYFIEPGFSYKYQILADQTVTTKEFDNMEPSIRNCSLTNENSKSNLTRTYSKSSCKYECAIKYAIKECNCIPWNIPKMTSDYISLCDLEETCFTEHLRMFSPTDCNCSSDCQGTSFSVFVTRKPISTPTNFCSDERIKSEYPFTVLCQLCRNVITKQRIRFVYEQIMNGWPDPNNLDGFCSKFVIENVALVKVEMVAKSLTRSVKDKRFNFVDQLSSLGNKKCVFKSKICNYFCNHYLTSNSLAIKAFSKVFKFFTSLLSNLILAGFNLHV